jgi:hypothetical protein
MLERAFEIRDAKPANVVRKRIGDIAAALSDRGGMAGRCELANEVIGELLALCYHIDEDGEWANLDPITYRIRKPVPWGPKGWKAWKLRKHESVALRAILHERQAMMEAAQRGYGPLVYDKDEHSWYLNLADFPTLEKALSWYTQRPISLREWRTVVQRIRNVEAKRKRKG